MEEKAGERNKPDGSIQNYPVRTITIYGYTYELLCRLVNDPNMPRLLKDKIEDTMTRDNDRKAPIILITESIKKYLTFVCEKEIKEVDEPIRKKSLKRTLTLLL